ncbi:unnamed protein product [Ambrosiozyma monospora]|uniref:Unnamed protein product n=1 Tax=Ambrosiozyma monospora TaxID=43982 RepID=A0ACB5TDX4_AMBMO|nr:unnamed protein product [Ambrosiozyma monospora]
MSPGGFLYEHILGLDTKANTAVVRGDKDNKFDVSYLVDIGKAVGAIVTFGDYGKLPNKIRISSDRITSDEALDHYEKIHPGVKITRTYVSKEDTYKKAHEMYDASFDFKDFFFYLEYIVSQGVDKGNSFSVNENELINPGESLFKWTKFGSI